MAGSVNKVILVGNLGKDPDVRRLNSGDQVVSFSVATSETWRDKTSGERKEKTEWHNVVIFNENLGKVAEQYCKKGTKVYLEGQLQTRKWQDQSGNDRYTTEVVLQRFRGELQLLDSRGGGEARESFPDEGRRRRSSGINRAAAASAARRCPAAAARSRSTTTFRSDGSPLPSRRGAGGEGSGPRTSNWRARVAHAIGPSLRPTRASRSASSCGQPPRWRRSSATTRFRTRRGTGPSRSSSASRPCPMRSPPQPDVRTRSSGSGQREIYIHYSNGMAVAEDL